MQPFTSGDHLAGPRRRPRPRGDLAEVVADSGEPQAQQQQAQAQPRDLDAVHRAAEAGDIEALRRAVLEGMAQGQYASVTLHRRERVMGLMPLHMAAEGNHVELVKFLLTQRVDIDAGDFFRVTALHLACIEDNHEVAQLLLQAQAQATLPDSEGDLPIHWAATEGHVDVMELLLSSKSPIDPVNNSGWTPLHRAANNGHVAAATYLLKMGAALGARNKDGHTALHLACVKNQLSMIEMLMGAGARMTVGNVRGLTPYDMCISDSARAMLDGFGYSYMAANGQLDDGPKAQPKWAQEEAEEEEEEREAMWNSARVSERLHGGVPDFSLATGNMRLLGSGSPLVTGEPQQPEVAAREDPSAAALATHMMRHIQIAAVTKSGSPPRQLRDHEPAAGSNMLAHLIRGSPSRQRGVNSDSGGGRASLDSAHNGDVLPSSPVSRSVRSSVNGHCLMRQSLAGPASPTLSASRRAPADGATRPLPQRYSEFGAPSFMRGLRSQDCSRQQRSSTPGQDPHGSGEGSPTAWTASGSAAHMVFALRAAQLPSGEAPLSPHPPSDGARPLTSVRRGSQMGCGSPLSGPDDVDAGARSSGGSRLSTPTSGAARRPSTQGKLSVALAERRPLPGVVLALRSEMMSAGGSGSARNSSARARNSSPGTGEHVGSGGSPVAVPTSSSYSSSSLGAGGRPVRDLMSTSMEHSLTGFLSKRYQSMRLQLDITKSRSSGDLVKARQAICGDAGGSPAPSLPRPSQGGSTAAASGLLRLSDSPANTSAARPQTGGSTVALAACSSSHRGFQISHRGFDWQALELGGS